MEAQLTRDSWIHWIVPTIAGVFLAASLMLIFVGYLTYLVDSYLMYAASAIAVNTVCRSACGAAAPLFTNYMFDALGIGGGGSLIGGIALVLAVIPFAFYKHGEGIRRRSRFAPTGLRKADEEEARRPTEGEKLSTRHNDLPPMLSDTTSTITSDDVGGMQSESPRESHYENTQRTPGQ